MIEEIRFTLKTELLRAVAAFDPENRQALFSFCGQVADKAYAIHWTREVEAALRSSEPGALRRQRETQQLRLEDMVTPPLAPLLPTSASASPTMHIRFTGGTRETPKFGQADPAQGVGAQCPPSPPPPAHSIAWLLDSRPLIDSRVRPAR